MALLPLGALFELGSTIIDRIWPDPTEANKAKLELMKLQQTGELQQIAGQLQINQAEAQNPNIFVAGWRPFIGWVCGAALAYQYIGRPMIAWGFAIAGHPVPPMPELDDTLWELLFGMLGLGALRTVEKVKRVAK